MRNPYFSRVNISCGVTPDTGAMQLNMFEDTTKQLKGKALQAILSIRSRYEKNSILKGMNYEESATGGNEIYRSEVTEVAQPRAHIPPSRQAKQFQMFDALHGLREALAAAERSPAPRRWHSEEVKVELGRTLAKLCPGERVTVVYYEFDAGEYAQLTGEVTKADGYWKCLQLGQVVIDFDEIWEIVQSSR